MDYEVFLKQKYSAECSGFEKLSSKIKTINDAYEKIIHLNKCIVYLSEIPDILFGLRGMLYTMICCFIRYIKSLTDNLNYDEYNVIKLNEVLNLILCGYKLSEQENNTILNIDSLPRVTSIEQFIYNNRLRHMQNYLRKKLFPYWQDKLSPECIKFIQTQYNENIKTNNEFIAKEDLLNEIYFVKSKPYNWREQLIDAGIPVDIP